MASQLRYEMAQDNVPMGDVEILVASLDSVWMRDYGPIVLKRPDGSRVVADCDYWRPCTGLGTCVGDSNGTASERSAIRIDGRDSSCCTAALALDASPLTTVLLLLHTASGYTRAPSFR